MANRYRNLIYSTAQYTEMYKDFSGVELNASSKTGSNSRLSYTENMYKDYDGDGADVIESIPGYRCFAHYGEKIHNVYYQPSLSDGEGHLIVHVGKRLMRHPVSDINQKNAVGTEIGRIADTKSFGFEYGHHFYVMDGTGIFRISQDGECRLLGQGGIAPYVPTVYVSGKPYEQRNLLTNSFKEEYLIADPSLYLYSTKGLKLVITDPYLRYCAVEGVSEDVAGEVRIPAYAQIGGLDYKVTEISERAFMQNTKITEVYIPYGLTSIGTSAFSGCTSLRLAVISDTVTEIGADAFRGATALATVYLGAGLGSIGDNAFEGCSGLTSVNYTLGEEDLGKIKGIEALPADNIAYRSSYKSIKIALGFQEKVEGLARVCVNGEETEYEATENGNYFENVILSFPSMEDATGITVVISGVLEPLSDWSADMNPLKTTTPYQAIAGCRIAEVFDERIFFSGNPLYPNTVFYTERAVSGREGMYIGRYNYFNDGIGAHRIISLLAVRDMLAVFKEGEDSSGSIFYHRKEAADLGAIDTIYPVSYVHSGIHAIGASLSFLDDPVFLSGDGLMALNSANINYQRNVVCRSHNVNYSLLKENLSEASLCEWLGYLVIGINGKMFLADSRRFFTHDSGVREYEWFFAKDIGAYTLDETVYRYSPDPYLDVGVKEGCIGDSVDYGSVYSTSDENGQLYYYTEEGTEKYRVVPTEERTGGAYHPATVFLSHGKLLFFGTDDGHLCVFNNDLRGVAPESVKASEGYSEEEYLAYMGGKLHPLFYSFAGHAPTYVIKTARDDCGVPHLTKNTVKKSLVINADASVPYSISCEVISDSGSPLYVGSLPISGSGFDSFDFGSLPWRTSRYSSTALNENEKKWVEKQLILTSQSFASPISVRSISYRYVIKGKIKNNI